MLQSNPQFQQLNQYMPQVQQMMNGKTPEEQQQVFMNTCKSLGVDANQMMQQYLPYLQGNQQMK